MKLILQKRRFYQPLPKWVMDKYNLKDKPIKLKTEIITRNTERHKDITTNDLKIILGISLYNPVIILQNDKSKNLCFLGKINTNKYANTVLDIKEVLNNYEIIHCHYMREKSKEQLVKRDKKYKSQ